MIFFKESLKNVKFKLLTNRKLILKKTLNYSFFFALLLRERNSIYLQQKFNRLWLQTKKPGGQELV